MADNTQITLNEEAERDLDLPQISRANTRTMSSSTAPTTNVVAPNHMIQRLMLQRGVESYNALSL